MGGAWAVAAGMDSVRIPLRDGATRIVATTDRAAFLDALNRAVDTALVLP